MKITYTKLKSRQYKASTGEIATFYTSKEFGGKNTKGWYITDVGGQQLPSRFDTLRDVKEYIYGLYGMAA